MYSHLSVKWRRHSGDAQSTSGAIYLQVSLYYFFSGCTLVAFLWADAKEKTKLVHYLPDKIVASLVLKLIMFFLWYL